MSQSITNLKDSAIHCLHKTVEVGKAIGQRIVTVDRSNEVYGDTPQAQLKGRDRMITHELANVALGALIVAFCTYQCIMHPGSLNYFMTGIAGFGTLVALKEVAIHDVARESEKKKFGIKEETKDTQYSFQEFIDESKQSFFKSFNRLFGQTGSDNVPLENTESTK